MSQAANSSAFKALKFLRWYQAIGVALVLAVIWLSLARIDNAPGFQSSDKLGHVLAYLGLSAWFGQIVRIGLPLVVACVFLLLLGIALELVQGMTGYRQTEFADALANGLGVLIGGVMAMTRLGRLLETLDRARSRSP